MWAEMSYNRYSAGLTNTQRFYIEYDNEDNDCFLNIDDGDLITEMEENNLAAE